jgi:ATP-dependent DNA helicase RecG
MKVIPARESMTVELKSDAKRLRDADLAAAVVCLANSQGGSIYLGVEKDGSVTGLHPDHRDATGLAAMIANRTVPSVSVQVTVLDHGGVLVAQVTVPRSSALVATSEGLVQRRRLKLDGEPECVPFLPHEFVGRQSDLGLIDHSAQTVAGATEACLDPLERIRLRQFVERYGGDRTLLSLGDQELDGALGLVRREGKRRLPTVTGLLVLGTEAALREHLPTHEVAFQVLQGTEVRVNEFHRRPLLWTFERVLEQLSVRITEEEIQVGLFRVPVPTFDPRALREAFVNAVSHRDYTRLGAVHVRWEADGLTFSNPGGFVEGVTLDNLLVTEPRPRNPALADVLKRLGLAERTGRGIDLIYSGLLRYGRPRPDYTRSSSTGVVVRLSNAAADLPFLRMIVDHENRQQTPLSLDALITLAGLREERRMDVGQVARAIQKQPGPARRVLEGLLEAGLVEGQGIKKERTYTLSAIVYRSLGEPRAYVRQAGFDAIRQEEMVKQLANQQDSIQRRDVMELCGLSQDQATRLLRRLVDAGHLVRRGERRGAHYVRAR